MKKIILTFLGIAALGAAAIVFYVQYQRPQSAVTADGGVDAATSSPATESPVVAETPKYKGQALEFLASPKDLAAYPKEFVESQQKKFAGILEEIKKAPKDETNWIDVGISKKAFNNFVGARDAWEYAKLLNSRAAIAYYNLGKLYSAYLSDNQKAEANLLVALDLDRNTEYPYLALADLYHDFYKEKYNKIPDILMAGIKAVPADPNLYLQLAFYYKDAGDVANAIKYFEVFLKLPNLTGTQQQAIQEEVAALKK